MNFEDFSLVLVKDEDVIYSSDKNGLRPIFMLVQKRLKGDLLYDKVIGLAAAMLMVKFDIAKRYQTRIISIPALNYFLSKRIDIMFEKSVDNIMNEDRTDVCPMEKKAENMNEDELFAECEKIFG